MRIPDSIFSTEAKDIARMFPDRSDVKAVYMTPGYSRATGKLAGYTVTPLVDGDELDMHKLRAQFVRSDGHDLIDQGPLGIVDGVPGEGLANDGNLGAGPLLDQC